MADWFGSARSNYVRVKDMDGLKAALEPWEIDIQPDDEDPAKDPAKVCFMSENQFGGWPSTTEIEVDDPDDPDGIICEEVEFDPAVHICPFLEPGQVLILMEIGAEKLRYLTGNAVAYHSDGRRTALSLDSIYTQAAQEFSVPLASISLAEY